MTDSIEVIFCCDPMTVEIGSKAPPEADRPQKVLDKQFLSYLYPTASLEKRFYSRNVF